MYEFTIQYPEKQQRFVTLGNVSVDFARLISSPQNKLILELSSERGLRGNSSTRTQVASSQIGKLAVTINCTPVRELVFDETLSLRSAISGFTESGLNDNDQDLNGFDYAQSHKSASMSSLGDKSYSNDNETFHLKQEASHANEEILSKENNSESVKSKVLDGEKDNDEIQLGHRENKHFENPEISAARPGEHSSQQNITMHRSTGSHSSETMQVSNESCSSIDTSRYQLGSHMSESEAQVSHMNRIDSLGDYDDPAARETIQFERNRANEAEAMLEEALSLIESERQALRQAEASIAQLKRDVEWSDRKFTKEKAAWEERTKDAFKKMEQTVLLTERIQNEKTELKRTLAELEEENDRLRSMVDEESIKSQIAEAIEKAKAEVDIMSKKEISSLQDRLREMNEFVEEADAKALRATAKAVALQSQIEGLSSNRNKIGQTYNEGGRISACTTRSLDEDIVSLAELKEAEEKADALNLELEYVKSAKERVEIELKTYREEADASVIAAQREAEMHASRALELQRQLGEALESSSNFERQYSQAQNQIVLLESALERANIHSKGLQQQIVGYEILSKQKTSTNPCDSMKDIPDKSNVESSSITESPSLPFDHANLPLSQLPVEMQRAILDVREIQDMAEARAAKLSSLTQELGMAKEEIVLLRKELQVAKEDTIRSKQKDFDWEEKIRKLQRRLQSYDADQQRLQELEDEMNDLLISKKAAGSNPDINLEVENKKCGELRILEVDESLSNICVLRKRVQEAEMLARNAAVQNADLVVELAAAKSEAIEAGSKLSDVSNELSRIKGGKNAELYSRIETLEHDLMVARNRAEVNALFREEHDRLAGDLVQSKLALAVAQEEIIVLKRQRFKSEEKQMNLASRLTSIEAKLYRRLTSKNLSIRPREKKGFSRQRLHSSSTDDKLSS